MALTVDEHRLENIAKLGKNMGGGRVQNILPLPNLLLPSVATSGVATLSIQGEERYENGLDGGCFGYRFGHWLS